MGELWGVWGGLAPGGWCYLHIDDRPPYAGTKEEAEKAVAAFLRDYPQHAYGAIQFDSAKEPGFKDGKATQAQRQALEAVDRTHRFPFQCRRATAAALHVRGWWMHATDADGRDVGMRVTAAGRRALQQK